ncbi:MAG TPA: DUF6786 family protein [Phycisphaerae bacterium]|nr:DUF6786 family protein [Phycisphaerae bacterium]
MRRIGLGLALLVLAAGCAPSEPPPAAAAAAGTFGDDLAFLKKHTDVIVLSEASSAAKVAVVPQYQGRVMTSSAEGDGGLSFGWINRELIASGKSLPHINVYGGEDRFWLGPEGGQFAIYFARGVPFDLEHWFVPPAIDTEPFDIDQKVPERVALRREFSVTNYSGTVFKVGVDREVRLLVHGAAWKQLGVEAVDGVQMVAYESVNCLTNAGTEPWKKETGLLSIWILGMFNPSPTTTIVVPIQAGPESELGKPVVDDYFGKVPAERLIVKTAVAYFSADGKCRTKIGVGPKRCKGILGSYDATNRVLTLVQFTFKEGVTEYVNSLWKLQDDPYGGDAANSYNDGPPEPGAKPMGPFYELESSSPAAALAPGETLEHVHRTIHITGPEEKLDPIARATLGVGLDEIKKAFR